MIAYSATINVACTTIVLSALQPLTCWQHGHFIPVGPVLFEHRQTSFRASLVTIDMETPIRGTYPCYALFVDPWHYIVFHSLQSLPVMLPLVTPPKGCSSILSIAQYSGLQTFAPNPGMRKIRGRKTLVAQSHVVPTWTKLWRQQNRRARETGEGWTA